MSAIRRLQRAAWFAGVAAVLPVASLAGPVSAASAAEPVQFRPPAGPMVLTRTIRRPLPGGVEVMTQRRYEIRIVADGDGYRIDGKLIDTEVQAPPAVAQLAALERKRPDTGMFPMHLDARGKLLPGKPAPTSKETRAAVELALQRVKASGLPPADIGKAAAFVTQIAARSGHTPWPEDLFSPQPGVRRQTETIPLPNGGQGEVEIEIEARADAPSGLLARFARTVTTKLGSDARVTEETWTLSGKS